MNKTASAPAKSQTGVPPKGRTGKKVSKKADSSSFPRKDFSSETRQKANEFLVDLARKFDELKAGCDFLVITTTQLYFMAAIKAVLFPTESGDGRSAQKYAILHTLGRVYVERAMMIVRDFPDKVLLILSGEHATDSLEEIAIWIKADSPSWKKWGEREPRTKNGTPKPIEPKLDIDEGLSKQLEARDDDNADIKVLLDIERVSYKCFVSNIRQLTDGLRTLFETDPDSFRQAFFDYCDVVNRVLEVEVKIPPATRPILGQKENKSDKVFARSAGKPTQ